jgi:hypothetical protein
MFDQFLITVNQWMTGGLAVAATGSIPLGDGQRAFQPLSSGIHPVDCSLCGRAGNRCQSDGKQDGMPVPFPWGCLLP